jgi:hypothetical protein
MWHHVDHSEISAEWHYPIATLGPVPQQEQTLLLVADAGRLT